MGIAFQRTATQILEQPKDQAVAAGGRVVGRPSSAPSHQTDREPRLACRWMLDFYDRHRWFYFSFLIFFYVAGFNGIWRPEPDSALYLSIGRNLAEGHGYTYNGMAHALAYPGMPYLHAILFRLFGLGAEWPALLVMLGMGLAALGLMYRLFLLYSDRATAVVLTCVTGMSYTLYRYAFELRNEMPFLVGVLAFLVGWEALRQARRSTPWRLPRWYDQILLVGGLALAIVMRPHMWALLMAAVGALLVAAVRSPHRWWMIAGMIAVITAAGGLLMLDPRLQAQVGGTYESALAQSVTNLFSPEGLQMLGRNLYDLVNSDMAEAAFGHELGPVLTIVAGTALAVLSALLIRQRAIWGLFVLGTLVMMVLAPSTMPRYLLPILPLMAIAWWGAAVKLNERLPHRWGNVAFVLMLVVWVVPNFLRICKTVGEQRYPPLDRSYAVNHSLRDMANEITLNVEPHASVLAHQRVARVLAYWSNRVVSADYEMAHPWVPAYIVWPGDAHAYARLERQNLSPGQVVARVPDPSGRETEWTLRKLIHVEHQPR